MQFEIELILNCKDWWNASLTAPWRSNRPGDWPCDVNSPAAIHQVPGMGPTVAPPDQMHTWHQGMGQHFCASIVAT